MSCIVPQTWVAWQSLHPPNPTFPGNVGISYAASLMESSWHPFLQRVFPFPKLLPYPTPLFNVLSWHWWCLKRAGGSSLWEGFSTLGLGLHLLFYTSVSSFFFHALVLGLANNLALKVWFQDPPFLPPEMCQIKLQLQQLVGKRDGQ